MLRLAADENFNGDIVRGILRRNPKLDIVRVQDVGLSGADDPSVLQWAADQGRIVVAHGHAARASGMHRSMNPLPYRSPGSPPADRRKTRPLRFPVSTPRLRRVA